MADAGTHHAAQVETAEGDAAVEREKVAEAQAQLKSTQT